MNIAELIKQQSIKHPDKDAVVFPTKKMGKYHYNSLTFSEFENRSNQYAAGFINNGISKGDKVLMFVKPCLDFSVITFSLFKIGAVPIFIDPGMGKKNLFRSIKSTNAVAMIAIPQVHYLRMLFPSTFKSIKKFFSTKNVFMNNAINIQNWRENFIDTSLLDNVKTSDDELAAILFTSGGTGSPKGVEYTHNIFATQTMMLQDLFGLNSKDIDLPGFPLFALFTMSMGMTSVIPDMDPSKPSKVKPKKIIQNILDKEVTFAAGSPAIWDKVGRYCLENKIKLPSIKYLVMFGAPVSTKIHEIWKEILPNGTTYTPYGATECLPVSCISGTDLEGSMQSKAKDGEGTCIGKPIQGVQIKVIKHIENIIEDISMTQDCPSKVIGEIIVKSPTATKNYHNLPEKTKEAKITDQDGFWHRMGDLGYFDEDGFLWFCGRCNHKVIINGEIHSPIQSEAVINNISGISRSALIPYKDSSAIVIEPVTSFLSMPILKNKLLKQVFQVSKEHPKTKHIKRVFIKNSFPVDVRHNIKIDRKKLKEEFWK